MTQLESEARSRLAIALDVSSLHEAEKIIAEVQPCLGVAKIGLQLFSVAGPAAVELAMNKGMDVVLDLKLHDIPNTVRSAATELGRLGVKYVTTHAQGGYNMLSAGMEGLAIGAEQAGLATPRLLAVTVLTSDVDAHADDLIGRARTADAAGCGIVCAAPDLPTVKTQFPEIFTLVPGIRLLGSDQNDQARIATPGDALAQGADLLVIGRTVTEAADMAKAAADVLADTTDALALHRRD